MNAPFFAIQPDNDTSWIVVITITFLIYSFLAVAGKVVSRLQRSSATVTSLKSYNWTVLASFIFALAQAVLIIKTCEDGLGQHADTLDDSTLSKARKNLFAASLMGIVVHMLAKLSTNLIIMAIDGRGGLRIACKVMMGVVIAWSVAAILVLSFRCGSTSPSTNDRDKCMGTLQTNIGINIVNGITDIGLVIIPVIILWSVQTDKSIRLRVIGLFSARLVVPIILFVQTTYMRNDDVVDETWSLVKPIILGQIALNASIITACVPSLKGVIDTFWSGATVFTAPAHYTTHNSQRSGLVYGVRSRFTKTQNTSQTPPAKSKSRDRSGDRSESQEDLHRSVIHRTVEYQVEYEREEMPRRSRTKK